MFACYQSADRSDETWKPIYNTYFGTDNESLLAFERYQGIFRIPDPKYQYYDAFMNLMTHVEFRKQYRFVVQNKDIDLVKFILTYDGLLLEHALYRHRDNIDIVKIAISQNKEASQFASRRVQATLGIAPHGDLICVYLGEAITILGDTVTIPDVVFYNIYRKPESEMHYSLYHDMYCE